MSKDKKTRQQKVIADLRRKLNNTKNNQISTVPTVSLKSVNLSQISMTKPTFTSTINSGAYLISDLKRTTFLTAILVGAEIILLFLLKHKIINLSMLQF